MKAINDGMVSMQVSFARLIAECIQYKHRYVCIKFFTIFGHAKITAMHGSYFCVAEDGEKFDADIPMFVLDALSNESGKRNLH